MKAYFGALIEKNISRQNSKLAEKLRKEIKNNFKKSIVNRKEHNTFLFLGVEKTFEKAFELRTVEKTEDKLIEQGLSDAQIEQTLEISGKFQTPEMILVFGIVGGIIMYLIIALIVTAITKKPNPDLEA